MSTIISLSLILGTLLGLSELSRRYRWFVFAFYAVIENLGLKPRRSTTALLLNISAFTKYMLKCETWKKPILTDFTPHPNKSCLLYTSDAADE